VEIIILVSKSNNWQGTKDDGLALSIGADYSGSGKILDIEHLLTDFLNQAAG